MRHRRPEATAADRARRGVARLMAMTLALSLLAPLSSARAETPATPTPPVEQPSPGGDQIRSFNPRQRDLTPEEFRAEFENKTVHLSAGGLHYGSEYYMPGDRSVWIGGDGPCRLGLWTYENAMFCFRYDNDGPYCWRVFESGGRFFAQSVDGLVLNVYAVEQKPLNCDPELFS